MLFLLCIIREEKPTSECTSMPGQKISAAHKEIRVLQIVFSLSGEYTQDLRFVHSTRKFDNIRAKFLRLNHFESNFVFTFIRKLFRPSTQGS